MYSQKDYQIYKNKVVNVCIDCECIDNLKVFNYNKVVNVSLIYKTCSVFGHSEIKITKELEDKLFATFENLINKGCEYFYFGGFGMFDDLCYKIITELKNKYTHIKRYYICEDYKFIDRPHKRPKWLKNEDYEEFIYLDLEFDWWYKRIYYRNCAMIDKSDFVIFYVEERENSGAYKAFKYAKQKKKKIINLK